MGGEDEGGRGSGKPSRASSATSSPQHLYHKSPQRVYGSLQRAGVGSIRRSHRLSGSMCLSYFTLDSLFFSWPHSQELLRIISLNLSSPCREAIFKQIFISFSPFFFLPLQVSLRRLWPAEKCAPNGRDAKGKACISVSMDLWGSLNPEWALFVFFSLAFSCNAISTARHNKNITYKAYKCNPIKRGHIKSLFESSIVICRNFLAARNPLIVTPLGRIHCVDKAKMDIAAQFIREERAVSDNVGISIATFPPYLQNTL